MESAARPQLGWYMPVGLLYRRRRRSGLTEKKWEQVMLLEKRQPTGKLSEETAHSGCPPNLQYTAVHQPGTNIFLSLWNFTHDSERELTLL